MSRPSQVSTQIVQGAGRRQLVVDGPRRVHLGPGALEAVGSEVHQIADARVYAIVSGTLWEHHGLDERLAGLLGEHLVGFHVGVEPHVPRHAVEAALRDARECKPTVLLNVGGGSTADCAKAVNLLLDEPFEDLDRGLDERGFTIARHRSAGSEGSRRLHIAVPTALSGAEYAGVVGITDVRQRRKEVFFDRTLGPHVVVLDPDMTTATPDRLWCSSGVKAIDHAVESLCSSRSTPFTDALAFRALELLSANLPRSRDAADTQARLDCLSAAWMAASYLTSSGVGLSHALVHQLGAATGTSHGEATACVLPWVMDFNSDAAELQLQAIAIRLRKSGRDEAIGAHPAACVRELTGSLGLPSRLRDLGVTREVLPHVATEAVGDLAVKSNPKTVSVEQASDVLHQAY